MDCRQVFSEDHFVERRVIEVGAGCGLTSIYAVLRGADVTITDMDTGEPQPKTVLFCFLQSNSTSWEFHRSPSCVDQNPLYRACLCFAAGSLNDRYWTVTPRSAADRVKVFDDFLASNHGSALAHVVHVFAFTLSFLFRTDEELRSSGCSPLSSTKLPPFCRALRDASLVSHTGTNSPTRVRVSTRVCPRAYPDAS